ncbi:MAG: hypothetical protein ACJ76X_06950 [Solirubrobacteraceae bacterium]
MTPLTVLTSAVGLGSYVAALLHQALLRDAGYRVDVEVVEGWFTSSHIERHLMHQTAFHRDFRLALAGRRMAGSVEGRLDQERISRLLSAWRGEGRARFLVWSGYWLPVLERYAASMPDTRIELDLCRIDAVESDSFRVHREPEGVVRRELWLWNWERRALGRRLPVPAGAPLPFAERAPRLVAHGGGWGLGTYADVLTEFSQAGYALDVLGPGSPDWDGRGPLDRRYVSDPQWHPWVRNAAGELTFPPLGEVCPDGEVRYRLERRYPAAHVNVREAMAVVSKPGGGTLLDSLAAATPVVLLAPWGEPEAKNGALWQELGFGIDFERWRETGFDHGVLEDLHHRLLEAREQEIEPLVAEAVA